MGLEKASTVWAQGPSMGTGLEGVDAVPEQGRLFPTLSGRMWCKSTDLMCGQTLPASFLCDLTITVPPVKHITCSVGSTANKHEELLRVSVESTGQESRPSGNLG